MKMVQNNSWKKLRQIERKNLQFCVLNHSSSFFAISNILQPWLFGHRPENGNSLMKFLGDLMSALFPDDHHQRFPQLRKD
jgi:hypothetical protein